MKKLFLLFIFAGCIVSIFAQKFHPNYQDGKIWFKIKNDYRVISSINDNPKNLPFSHLPLLNQITKKYNVTRLSRPFFAAKGDINLEHTYLLEFTDYMKVEEIIKELQSLSGIDYAEKVPLDKPCLTPNDPNFSSQWALTTIDAQNAWNYFSTGSNIVIAIVDDAVERSHTDLSPNLWVNSGEIANNGLDDDNNGYIDDINGYDVGSDDNNPDPPTNLYDHGTHVAGIASASTNNGVGVASIGFSCKLMCVKATTSDASITNGYDGIVYAANAGAHIINCSWGGPVSSITGQNVINYAWNNGCIIVAAAGNDNVNTQFYPAAYDNVISVAATSFTDAKASFSNYGTWIDISAPGSIIYSTIVGNSYGIKSGTSMASPMVAGLLGLMWSLNPSMPRADLINCLLTTATNIDSQNPSYVGELGSGRINAAQAMQCVSLSLNNPPVADFTANFTSITAGGQIQFTDLSTYNPTSWSWSFPGGTPSSFNGQNPPPITYNTPGTYSVTLTVSNANGTDSEIKSNYIQVNSAAGCQGLNYPIPSNWTLSNYYTGSSPGADGWVNGMNVYQDKQKAMYFDASSLPYNYLTQVYIAFGLAYSANPNKIVPIKIYDGTAGPTNQPGALLATSNLTMGEIMSDVAGNYYTIAEFASPVSLPASKRFFVSVDLSNLQWSTSVKDTLSILSNTIGNPQPQSFPIWEQQSDNNWYRYGSTGSWNIDVSLIIHPFLTDQPVVAQFTQSDTIICTGESITFDATGSTYQDTLLWVFPGGTPYIVSSNPNPTVFFNTPGTHTVKMYVIGGGCSQLDSAESIITVNPTPSVSISTPNNEICVGQSTTLNASGATSYTWYPSSSLSASTGSSVIASPSTTTTYYVSGTTGSCTGHSTIEIRVIDPPNVLVTNTNLDIQCNQTVVFDASGSSNVSSFSWNFDGGTPATSNASSVTVQYNNTGSFTVTLHASNSCGIDSSYSVTVNVTGQCNNVSLDENEIQQFQAWYAPIDQDIVIQYFSNQPSTISLINGLGQVVSSQQIQSIGQQSLRINVTPLAAGIYILRFDSGTKIQHVKLRID